MPPLRWQTLAQQWAIACAAMSLAGGITGALSPLLVGGIAALAGGGAGWRWAYLALAIPV